jgi:hypothetical protein
MAKKRSKKKTKAVVISFRCPPDLLPEIDSYLGDLKEETPGGNWTRSSAALNAVALGLRAAKKKKAERQRLLEGSEE